MVGSSDEASACRVGAWLLGHPSAAAVPMPQLCSPRPSLDSGGGAAKDKAAGNEATTGLSAELALSKSPRTVLLAAVRVIEASLRAERARGGKPLIYPARRTRVPAKASTDAPLFRSMSASSHSRLVVEMQPCDIGDTGSCYDVARPPSPASAQFQPLFPLAARVFTNLGGSCGQMGMLQALVAVAELCGSPAQPPSSEKDGANLPALKESRVAPSSLPRPLGPTRLQAAAAHTAVRAAVALAAAAAAARKATFTKPPNGGAATSTSSSGFRRSGDVSEALWEQRSLLKRILVLLRDWNGALCGESSSRCRPAAVAFDDLLAEVNDLDEVNVARECVGSVALQPNDSIPAL